MRKQIRTLNNTIRKCKKCRLNKTRIHAIFGEGNLDAKIMLVAQAPGIKEDEVGKMFIGPSGIVLDDLLEFNNVQRENLYITNLIKCMLPNYRKPKQDEIDICSEYLDEEIKLIDPTVLVPLGHYSTKYILEKYNLEILSKKDFNKLYGKLTIVDGRKILPLQHPAAIVYNPDLKEVLMNNYHKLQVLSKTCKWYEVCPMKRYYEKGMLDKKWIELYCKGDWENCVRYHLEESGKPHADFMLPDGTLNEKLEKY
jgi:uracil-DNA glycosylase family 4